MGSVLSLPVLKKVTGDQSEKSTNEACKRLKISEFSDDYPRLIPSLPDEISFQILARVPRIQYLNLKLVCQSWKAAITSNEVFQIRKEIKRTEEWLYILKKVEADRLLWHALDPGSGTWQQLPPMPNVICDEESKTGLDGIHLWNLMGFGARVSDIIKSWFGRRDSLDRLPFCGCTVGAADGCLYVLGGFSKALAMRCVWKYDPQVNLWYEISPMSTGRAFCKTSLLKNKLYVVGGVTRGRGGLTPLQSAEVFDPTTGVWSPVPSMPFSKAQILPAAFLADMLKPIATGMTSYRGRLCVPQSLYSWPFFVDVGGEIYEPETDRWVEMPAGMGEGWPARHAGTKLSVVVDGELYALDPSSSLDSGKIKMYDPQKDSWKVVIAKVPVRDFTDSESPYLLAGFLGKLHVITKDANNDTMVLEADLPKDACLPSSSGASASTNNIEDNLDSPTDVENDRWKIVASKNFGTADLVSCQVLDI